MRRGGGPPGGGGGPGREAGGAPPGAGGGGGRVLLVPLRIFDLLAGHRFRVVEFAQLVFDVGDLVDQGT
ncbi:hypothetical protein, partial [Nocardia farcinica]|uniref:hypothetical protein n=1 Tax=Nocardia farcinica TaxID=37329 RepID=UPI00245612E8